MNEIGARRGESIRHWPPAAGRGKDRFWAISLAPHPPQELRHQGGDSTWVGGAPLSPTTPHPAWSVPSRRNRRAPSASPPPPGKDGGGRSPPPAAPPPAPAPAPHPALQGEGERVAPAPTDAAICSPTSISPETKLANYRVNHCARGSGGKKRRGKSEGRGPGWNSPLALDWLKPVRAPREEAAESPSPLSPPQNSGDLSHHYFGLPQMETGGPPPTNPTHLPMPHSAWPLPASVSPSTRL